MNSAGLNNSDQTIPENQSSSETDQTQEDTMSLVYPDGRVTNVKVRQKKSRS